MDTVSTGMDTVCSSCDMCSLRFHVWNFRTLIFASLSLFEVALSTHSLTLAISVSLSLSVALSSLSLTVSLFFLSFSLFLSLSLCLSISRSISLYLAFFLSFPLCLHSRVTNSEGSLHIALVRACVHAPKVKLCRLLWARFLSVRYLSLLPPTSLKHIIPSEPAPSKKYPCQTRTTTSPDTVHA